MSDGFTDVVVPPLEGAAILARLVPVDGTGSDLDADKVRGRSRVGAIAMMAALNSAYAVVVAHNYRTVP